MPWVGKPEILSERLAIEIGCVGAGLVPTQYVLPKRKEDIRTQKQDIYHHQSTTRQSSFQARKQIGGGNEHHQPLYRRDNITIVIPIPVRDRAFKDEIGERKEVMMPVVVMRQKVETAVDEQTPRENHDPLGVEQVIPNTQKNQNQWDRIEDIKESLPRLHEVSGIPEFTLRCLKDKCFDREKDEHWQVRQDGTNEGVDVKEGFVSL